MKTHAGTAKVNKVRVSFFGGFRIEIGGRVLTDEANRSQKLWNVLAYLIFTRDRYISQNEFIEMFWPDDNGSNPVNALKTLLYRTRAMLELFSDIIDPLIISLRGAYSWNPQIECEVDIDQFSELCSQAHS